MSDRPYVVLTEEMKEMLDASPEEIGISLRTANALEQSAYGVVTLRELLAMSWDEIVGIKNLSTKTVAEIKDALYQAGFLVPGKYPIFVDESECAAATASAA